MTSRCVGGGHGGWAQGQAQWWSGRQYASSVTALGGGDDDWWSRRIDAMDRDARREDAGRGSVGDAGRAEHVTYRVMVVVCRPERQDAGCGRPMEEEGREGCEWREGLWVMRVRCGCE